MPSMSYTLLEAAKAEARVLCDALKAAGTPIPYGQCLERVAQEKGYSCWRAYSAAIKAVQAPVAPQPRMLGNRALLRIVADYRMKHYDIRLPEVLTRLATDHPQVTFDRAKVEAIMRQTASETIIAARALAVTRGASRPDEEFERYVRNPGFNPGEEDDVDLTGTPEQRVREALERRVSHLEDEVSDSEEAGDHVRAKQALEEHGRAMGVLVAAEFAEEFDEEGEVIN